MNHVIRSFRYRVSHSNARIPADIKSFFSLFYNEGFTKGTTQINGLPSKSQPYLRLSTQVSYARQIEIFFPLKCL